MRLGFSNPNPILIPYLTLRRVPCSEPCNATGGDPAAARLGLQPA